MCGHELGWKQNEKSGKSTPGGQVVGGGNECSGFAYRKCMRDLKMLLTSKYQALSVGYLTLSAITSPKRPPGAASECHNHLALPLPRPNLLLCATLTLRPFHLVICDVQ
jgi:hypothetical protein